MHIISNRCVHLPTTHRGVASIHPVSAQASPPPFRYLKSYFDTGQNAAFDLCLKTLVFAYISQFRMAIEHN